MTKILTVTPDQLEALAFANPGVPIHVGAHESDLELDGVLYIARTEGAA